MTANELRTSLGYAVQALENMRQEVAKRSQELAERELEGRELRIALEDKMLEGGSTKTEAEKRAKVDPDYLAHERHTAQLEHDHAVADAKAESLRFQVILGVGDLQRTWAEETLEPVQ